MTDYNVSAIMLQKYSNQNERAAITASAFASKKSAGEDLASSSGHSSYTRLVKGAFSLQSQEERKSFENEMKVVVKQNKEALVEDSVGQRNPRNRVPSRSALKSKPTSSKVVGAA